MTRTYGYDAHGRLAGITQSVSYENPETVSFGYDLHGRLDTVTYPKVPGLDDFAVRYGYDSRGNVTHIDDEKTGLPLWTLQVIDQEGRATQETLSNGVVTQHEYAADSGMLEHLVTYKGATQLQDLSYTYDGRLNMLTRSDSLQQTAMGARTEFFMYDVLDRLTCTDVVDGGVRCGAGGPCACDVSLTYAASGNIDTKSDVGAAPFTYDPQHPHAVAGAGGASYGYDAVGNQTSRPGTTLEYTARDLPSRLVGPSGEVRFEYDGEGRRVRKWSQHMVTTTFDNLFERVRTDDAEPELYRIYVPLGSSTLVVTRKPEPNVATWSLYLHRDVLGSVDVVTDANGVELERRSYDAFGAPRNPSWGQPGPATAAKIPVGFTGHVGDEELGLVNMRGRIYDPVVARFLMTDPVMSDPSSTQRWNAYSYVQNNPLRYTDPSGLDGSDAQPTGYQAAADGSSVDFNDDWLYAKPPEARPTPIPVTPHDGPLYSPHLTESVWTPEELQAQRERDDIGDFGAFLFGAVNVPSDTLKGFIAYSWSVAGHGRWGQNGFELDEHVQAAVNRSNWLEFELPANQSEGRKRQAAAYGMVLGLYPGRSPGPARLAAEVRRPIASAVKVALSLSKKAPPVVGQPRIGVMRFQEGLAHVALGHREVTPGRTFTHGDLAREALPAVTADASATFGLHFDEDFLFIGDSSAGRQAPTKADIPAIKEALRGTSIPNEVKYIHVNLHNGDIEKINVIELRTYPTTM